MQARATLVVDLTRPTWSYSSEQTPNDEPGLLPGESPQSELTDMRDDGSERVIAHSCTPRATEAVTAA